MTPLDRAAAAVRAYERNVRDVIRWAHPSWLEGALGVDAVAMEPLRAALSNGPRVYLDNISFALWRASGMSMPDIATFIAPSAAMLNVLPPDDGLRMLRARALLFRGAQVRRLIDKESRRRLIEWTGVALDSILWASPGTPDIAAFALSGAMPSLDEMDAQALAQEGYFLVARDERESTAMTQPCALLRLALPRDAVPPEWLNARARGLDKQGTSNLITHLPTWLPEWKWLFG